MCIVVSISWETPGSYCLDDSCSSLCAVSKRVNEQAAQLTYRFCFLCVCTDGNEALENEKNVRVPEESDIMKLRGDPETFKTFFVRKLLPCTVYIERSQGEKRTGLVDGRFGQVRRAV